MLTEFFRNAIFSRGDFFTGVMMTASTGKKPKTTRPHGISHCHKRPKAEKPTKAEIAVQRWNVLHGWGVSVQFRDPSRGLALTRGITVGLATLVDRSPFDPQSGTPVVQIAGCPVLVPLALVKPLALPKRSDPWQGV